MMIKQVFLSDILKFKNGKKRPKEGGTVPVYGGNGILGYSNSSNSEECIIIGRVGAYCGNVYYEKNKCWISDNAISAYVKEGIDIVYAYYLLKSLHLNKRKIGTSQPLLTQEILNNIETPIIPYFNQIKVGKILSIIDEKIYLNTEINNNLEQQAQAVYYKMFSEVNTVPVELSSIIDVRDGTHDSPKAQATGYYLITSKHLLPFGVDKASANYISKADFNKINERSLVETQDILMSMIGTIGLISYIPYETVDFAIKNVALFKTSHTPELAYYFLCYLKSEKTLQHIEKCLAGSTQKYISLGELRKMPIYSPTTNEIREFNCLVKPMFEKIVSRTYENALLAEMRDSLLPKLMSGELDVSDIDI